MINLMTILMKIKQHNSKWPHIPNHPYRILIVGGSGSGKTNALLNLINNQPDIYKIYLYAKDPYKAKYQHLINKREKVGIDHFNDPKAFTEYSNDMQDVYKNIEESWKETKNIKGTVMQIEQALINDLLRVSEVS